VREKPSQKKPLAGTSASGWVQGEGSVPTLPTRKFAVIQIAPWRRPVVTVTDEPGYNVNR